MANHLSNSGWTRPLLLFLFSLLPHCTQGGLNSKNPEDQEKQTTETNKKSPENSEENPVDPPTPASSDSANSQPTQPPTTPPTTSPTAPTLTSTDDLPEGQTNIYYTDTRVTAHADVAANSALRHSPLALGLSNGLVLSDQTLSLGLASASTTGALSASDFNLFTSKEPSLGAPDSDDQLLVSDSDGSRRWIDPSTLIGRNISRSVNITEDWISSSAAGNNGWAAATSGSGAGCAPLANMDNIHQGLMRCRTGTTTSGRATLHLGNQTLRIGNGPLSLKTALHVTPSPPPEMILPFMWAL